MRPLSQRRQAMGGGGTCAMSGRATGRLRAVIRGIKLDVASSPLQAVNLLFNAIFLPVEGKRIIAKSSLICQSPTAKFLGQPHCTRDLVVRPFNKAREQVVARHYRFRV